MPARERLDRAVAWALGLWLASFPLMAVFLVLVSWVAAAMNVELGSGSPREQQLNAIYVLAVLLVLASSALLGARAWRRRRRVAGLVIAGLAATTGVLFVLVPVLLS